MYKFIDMLRVLPPPAAKPPPPPLTGEVNKPLLACGEGFGEGSKVEPETHQSDFT